MNLDTAGLVPASEDRVPMTARRLLLLGASALTAVAAADGARAQAAELPPVVVTGDPLRSPGQAAPVTVLAGDELVRRRAGSLGETLEGLPGLGQSWFGPNSSRPTVRGFDGERVRVLQNGASSLDASTLSFDHAVPIEPLMVDRIEVLRGPAALVYGGSAIGGVVNVLDGRIAREPVRGPEGAVELRFGGAARERSRAARLRLGDGSIALQADAFERDHDELRVPRFTPVADGVAGDPTTTVRNSQSSAGGAGVGAAWTGENLGFGLSVDRHRSRYGIVVEPDVTIALVRNRVAFSGESRARGTVLPVLRTSVQFTDYRHDEIEGSGEVGTAFASRGTEWRAEAEHRPFGGWRGVFGVHLERFDFSAQGEEAFVPATDTRRDALYLIEEHAGAWGRTRAGVRVERARVSSDGDADPADAKFGPPAARRFTLASASLSHVAPLAAGWEASGSFSLTERAPTSFELFANGVHVATAAFERGDPALRPERGVILDLATRWRSGDHSASAGVWVAQFSRYLSLDATGRDIDVIAEDGSVETFPEFAFRSVPARLHGIELAARSRVAKAPWAVDVSGHLDWQRASNRDTGEALPRIAPWRAVLGVEAASGPWSWQLQWAHYGRQDRVPATDTPTDGFDRVSLLASRDWTQGDRRVQLFARLDNATDALGFNAGSIETVRRQAPLPGRSLRLGLRADL